MSLTNEDKLSNRHVKGMSQCSLPMSCRGLLLHVPCTRINWKMKSQRANTTTSTILCGQPAQILSQTSLKLWCKMLPIPLQLLIRSKLLFARGGAEGGNSSPYWFCTGKFHITNVCFKETLMSVFLPAFHFGKTNDIVGWLMCITLPPYARGKEVDGPQYV